MRRLTAITSALLLSACAAQVAVAVPPPPAPEAAVVPPAPSAPPEDPAVRARADAAVLTAEQTMDATAERCATEWLEPTNACTGAMFEPLATDFQAYYSEHAVTTPENARLDSLARLGGPNANVPQITEALTHHCEERCRTRRVPVLESAMHEAADKCFTTKAGDAVCHAFVKKLTATVRPAEAEHWADECFGICEDKRQAAKARAAIDRQRPKTQAESIACKEKCKRDYGGGWCGTPLVSCYSRCTLKGDPVVIDLPF